MAEKLKIPGVDWDELIAGYQGNIDALQEANRQVVRDARGVIDGMLTEVSGLIEDCDDLQRKSRRYEEAIGQLVRANQTLMDEAESLPVGLLDAVAPRLLSPFTSIRSFSEILSDYPALPIGQRNGFLDIAIKECDRLTRLIDQIVDLSRIRSDRAAWRIADVDPGDAVRRAVSETEPLYRDKVVRLDVVLPDELPAVRADPDRLAQVIGSILANAAKFSEPGSGEVNLSAEEVGDAVRFNVRDHGPGVAPERRGIIFARFLDADDTLPDGPLGAGLSLALCKEIVERLGGQIRVDSSPGEGACFSFTAPRAGTAAAAAR